jgi:hypothetical protein
MERRKKVLSFIPFMEFVTTPDDIIRMLRQHVIEPLGTDVDTSVERVEIDPTEARVYVTLIPNPNLTIVHASFFSFL